MTEDLDGRDLAEVRHRVVDPVVQGLMAPEEVQRVTVQFGLGRSLPPYEDGYDRDAEVWLRLTDADDDEHWHGLGYAGYAGDVGRWDALAVARELAGALIDLIAESSYGRGQWRDLDVEAVVPPPRWPPTPPGMRRLEMYAALDVGSPIWERGVNVPLDTLPVSLQLRQDIAAWQDTYLALHADDVAEETAADMAVLDSLDPARLRLVGRLRDELPGPLEVLRPLPRPPADRAADLGAVHGQSGAPPPAWTGRSGVVALPDDDGDSAPDREEGRRGLHGW